MKKWRTYFLLAIIIIISSMFLAGCAIGVRPRAYEEPSSEYYSSSTSYDYNYYYSSARASSFYYNPGYDPWTMGTYYQSYSGPPRTYGSPSTSSSSSQVENKRPSSTSRDYSSTSQSQAPKVKDDSALKRDRTSIRERSNITPGSSDSAITSQKVRRESSRTTDESNAKNRRAQSRIKPASESQTQEDDDKDSQNTSSD